ncbi:MAG: ThuA domain-containing protein, partial [Gemmatimonadota bacterium]|nr:ThuA domain-containing protein [Gemmatimonadota bacterium]
MKIFPVCLLMMLTAFSSTSGAPADTVPGRRTIKVLVHAEGYHYGKAAFELAEMLGSREDCSLHADFANTENIFAGECLAEYDVLVLFNHNDITAVHEKNITTFVRSGKGLVALHHVINQANGNPELTRLIGGYYRVQDGMVEHRDFNITRIPGKVHPILEGVPDKFMIYNDQDFRIQFYPGKPVDRLLSCEVTDNGPQEDCGWTRTEGAGRVVFLSPGDPVGESPFIVNKP